MFSYYMAVNERDESVAYQAKVHRLTIRKLEKRRTMTDSKAKVRGKRRHRANRMHKVMTKQRGSHAWSQPSKRCSGTMQR